MTNKQQTILVCGGAGYIGSHMVRILQENGMHPIVFDNFSTGNRQAVSKATIIEGCLTNPNDLHNVFATHAIDAVMHFAAKSIVSESVTNPYNYFLSNVTGTLNLLQAMHQAKVKRLVFSSTAAVYGNPIAASPIAEDHPKHPTNPYGTSKKQIEEMLQAGFTAYGLNSVSLRYFNAAGAHPEGNIGEAHRPETHLIPNALLALVQPDKTLNIFGDDYDTPDGTCIRDYIHIMDLCKAHLLALSFLDTNQGAFQFNLGNGKGFSVKEIVETIQEVTGKKVPYSVQPRRAGDPPYLVANSSKAQKDLGWTPEHASLHHIIATAWAWHQHPQF